MIIALGGRRIDAADAKICRFPPDNVSVVRKRLQKLFAECAAKTLVSSAACGADLIALSEAGALGMRRRIVLPFNRERFRKRSVVDRPGDWSAMYDRILDEVSTAGDLILLNHSGSESEAYAAANLAILDDAVALGQQLHEPVVAVLVWDGKPRGDDDLTQALGDEARSRGLRVLELQTK